MGRFDKPPKTEQLNAQSLKRIESALGALVDSLSSLNALPEPVVNVEPPRVDLPAPVVNTEVPLEGVVDAIARAFQEAVESLPEPTLPPINFDGVTADADLTPLVEATQNQQAVLEALKDKIANISAGTRSHFDGRLRNNEGLIQSSNPLAVDSPDLADIKRGITDYETRFDYDSRTDNNPVYLGKASNGTATTEDDWTIQKFTYDSSDRVTQIQVKEGQWDDRTNLF